MNGHRKSPVTRIQTVMKSDSPFAAKEPPEIPAARVGSGWSYFTFRVTALVLILQSVLQMSHLYWYPFSFFAALKV